MIYNCKICGAPLEITQGKNIYECEYCGTKQTVPTLDNEKIANLYDRASYLRRNNDFDKASLLYEQVLVENSKDAEAYWSIVLCRYGIEYVEDPKTNKRIPTINRVQYESILKDKDYLMALKCADEEAKKLYIEEAEYIDSVQKGILEISNKEEPYDIFICYKETDNNGRRTIDSVLAQDIYKQLINEGYKVFFSRITLEDKLGSAYEPYIFAALNSAKVMLVIGTNKDNFNAVWVKNEWSRYLALINKGAEKTLIPCYKDMNPYEMPEEFSYLQAQDISKIGFLQDLIRGIGKIIPKYDETNSIKSSNEMLPNKKELEINGGLYVGEAIAGKPHGFGKIIYPDNTSFEGEWAFGKEKNGKGTIKITHPTKNTQLAFRGEIKDFLPLNGEGSYFDEDGDLMTGKVENGIKNGYITQECFRDDTDWQFYEGEYVNNERSGFGKVTLKDGTTYKGNFSNDSLNGYAEMNNINGDSFVGEWIDGAFYKGKYTWASGGVYEGEFKDATFNGYGKYTYEDGSIEEGNWVDGELCN